LSTASTTHVVDAPPVSAPVMMMSPLVELSSAQLAEPETRAYVTLPERLAAGFTSRARSAA
jgi:hypothetical protein